jgi:glycosyltransferase involved in cell wall biosynthesis
MVFEVMGDGSSLESLQQLAKERGVEEHVRFLGRIDASETPHYYMRAKAFVLPSANEGMSNALLEALASGLPVIVTDTGGSQELVENGKNGYIIPRTSKAIIESLKKLLQDEALRAEMGRASRIRAEQQSWQAVAEEYREVYRQAAKKEA